jgi:hypothetical protein
VQLERKGSVYRASSELEQARFKRVGGRGVSARLTNTPEPDRAEPSMFMTATGGPPCGSRAGRVDPHRWKRVRLSTGVATFLETFTNEKNQVATTYIVLS